MTSLEKSLKNWYSLQSKRNLKIEFKNKRIKLWFFKSLKFTIYLKRVITSYMWDIIDI